MASSKRDDGDRPAWSIPAIYVRCRSVYTHTVPVEAYRGAGRPEAAYVLERLVDECARALSMPREEIRALNFIKPAQMPYHTPTDRTYDVGEFEGAMREALAKADYAGFEKRAETAKAGGKLRGVGIASYIECTAWYDLEEGSVELGPDGTFTVLIGTQSNGQGHETAYAQAASQFLDVPLERIKVVQGDTDRVKTGYGTGGSRSIPIGAVMVTRASEKLADSLKELAADKLEAAVADLEIADGRVRIAGTDRSISYEEIAKLPGATPDKLIATASFTPPNATYPNGTHVCEVEIDSETFDVSIERYTVVDDFGFTLNPLLLRGQVHGGIVQGVGQALYESTVFSEDGQLLTASFMDYCMPRADHFPDFLIRDAQRAVENQSAWPQRGGRSRLDWLDACGDERGQRRSLAPLRTPSHRHARDALCDLQGGSRGREHLRAACYSQIRVHENEYALPPHCACLPLRLSPPFLMAEGEQDETYLGRPGPTDLRRDGGLRGLRRDRATSGPHEGQRQGGDGDRRDHERRPVRPCRRAIFAEDLYRCWSERSGSIPGRQQDRRRHRGAPGDLGE